uniref:Integrase catalytic domain-containing protein n=1 Tax=Plectus sambesii TaxID=2011161 RepID=A0A914WTJ3_9BILA
MVKNMYSTIKERYYWDTIQWDCKVFCAMCPCCQRNKPLKVEAPTLHPVPPPRDALTQWGIDLVNLPMAEGGYKHLVVAIKHLTKWVEARPLKTKGAGEVLEFFEELCSRFGMPKLLISDQGREFCYKLLNGFCEADGIDHQMTAAYHPQARFAVDNKLEEGSEQAGENHDEEQSIMIYLASINAHFDDIKHQRNIAHTKIKIKQVKQKKAYDGKHTPCPFKKGDLVKLQQSRKGTWQGGKMLANFIGPLTSSEEEGESPQQEQPTSNEDDICEAVTIKLPNPNTRFSFKPPSAHYFDAVCKKLRICAVECIKYGKECEFFVRVPPKETIDVAGDGNCRFWALSLATMGIEAFHTKLWKAVCSTLLQEHKEFRSFIGGADDSKLAVSNYLKESKMKQVWATGIELKAAARLLGMQIRTLCPTW